MRFLGEKESEKAWEYFDAASEIAKENAKCLKSQRGVVIVKNGVIIGKGYNAPPKDEPTCEYCLRDKFKNMPLGTEPCRAIHAEERAIIDALKKTGNLEGAIMCHIKIKLGEIVPSTVPSCTICSKLVAEEGMKFVMWTKEGVALYEPKEFNELSFGYVQKQLNNKK